ncbi:MAG TPA: hypothetical protein VEF76_08700 [Patescibacteria group bacterium]|nr:hypothetical protein [Patescibacteria group bacterium]
MNQSASCPIHKESSLTDISKDCFAAMQSKMSLALTTAYHREEMAAIRGILRDLAEGGVGIDHFIAIGSGDLRYIDVAHDFGKTYTAIEPSLANELTLSQSAELRAKLNIGIVPKRLEDVNPAELPEGRRLFFFLFNVFPYIPDALALQKTLVRPGDLVVVSAWNNDSFEARRLQDMYYEHLGREFKCDLHGAVTNGYIDKVEAQSRSFARVTSRVKGRTTDILTMQVK